MHRVDVNIGRASKPLSESYFDCRKWLKKGDLITYGGFDREEVEAANGTLPLKEAYERFVILKGKYTNVTINRWDIIAVNGHKVTTGGCFVNVPTLEERGIK